MQFEDAEKPHEFVESIRNTFRAYVPESDAWAKPNFFDVSSTVVGGIAWSAVNEARNGVDTRMNPQTAVGEYLDIIAATPPLNLTRLTATQSSGFVDVDLPGLTSLPIGYEFETEDEVKYHVDTVTSLTNGKGIVPVTSNSYGKDNNSRSGQPLTSSDGTATSLGIFGAYDDECDDQLRRRIYAERVKFHFFGSACSFKDVLSGFPGVSRGWSIQDGGVAKILFLMEDVYDCGEPQQGDIQNIINMFNDECLTQMFFCPNFEGAKSLTINPEITWGVAPDDFCQVQQEMTEWLRSNFELGDGVKSCDIQRFLDDNYPELNPSYQCCLDFPPVCDGVYNCVELLNGC